MQVYETCAAPVVESVLNGYNGTIFAYGQVRTCTPLRPCFHFIRVAVSLMPALPVAALFDLLFPSPLVTCRDPQTGAGKTHTMEGYPDPPDQRGIIPNSFKHIFDRVAISENQQFLVRASYLEIYNEEIRDLLSRDPKYAHKKSIITHAM